jgi:hypothetical protein
MPSSDYYQKQADVCLKLAGLADSPEIATHLINLAADYKYKAAVTVMSQRARPAAEGMTSQD